MVYDDKLFEYAIACTNVALEHQGFEPERHLIKISGDLKIIEKSGNGLQVAHTAK
jgi:hypothetical protein